MTECHLSLMSQQTTKATNRASVMHAVIHAWYMSGLISRAVYIMIVDSGPRGLQYIVLELHCINPRYFRMPEQFYLYFVNFCHDVLQNCLS